MSTNHWDPGLGHVPAYLISAVPYVTSSISVENSSGTPTKISFPYVTKFVRVENIDQNNHLRVGFSENGVKANPATKAHYFELEPSGSLSLDVRVSELFLLGHTGTSTAQVAAGMTGVKTSHLYQNWSGSSGI